MAKKHGPLCICDRCTTTPRMAEMRRDRKRKLRDIGTAAGIVAAVYTSGTNLPQQGPTPLRDTANTLAEGERTTRARGQRKETGYKGRQRGGSSRKK